MEKNRLVSIIIPTLNEEQTLPDLLSCIENQHYKNFEVIVADAGSTDRTQKIAEEWGAKVIEGGLPGIGRNNGSKIAKGEYLVFIDADVRFDDDLLEKALDEFMKKDFDFAIPYFYTDHEKRKFKLFFKWSNFYKRMMKYTRFPDGTGQLVFAKASAFKELGMYPDFKVAEDTDLFWRAARNKFKVGTLNQKFYSSTRRLEKIGIFWTMTAFAFIGIFLFLGIASNKRIQNWAAKLYGGFGK